MRERLSYLLLDRYRHIYYQPITRGTLLFFSLTLLPISGQAEAGNYTRHYQSYLENENATEVSSSAEQRPQNRVSTSEGRSVSDNHIVPESAFDTQAPADVGSATVKTSSTSTLSHSAKSADASASDTAIKEEQVSVLRLRQNELPVHWSNLGNNMEAGGLHGNIGSQIEIDDNRRSDNSKNGGKFKLATIQAFLRHDELPNWYFGFYNAREDNYKGMFSNQDYSGSNTINEAFVGHIFETWRGNIGTELMVGSESASKRWKYRFKLWQDLRIANKWSVAGYLFGEYQPQNSQEGNNDLSQYSFETEPVLQYRVNPDMGVFLRPFYSYKHQGRENWGDIVEEEWKASVGIWRNWYPLLSSVYLGIGQKKTTNSSDSSVLFYDGRYKYFGGTLSYPVVGELRLYGELQAKFSKEDGEWTEKGHSWNPFAIVGVTYNF